LSRPFSEVELYKERFESVLRENPGLKRPQFCTMRYTAVYDRPDQWETPVHATARQLARFENLFKNLGGVTEGFAEEIDLETLKSGDEFDVEAFRKNLMFGTPDEVIAKLKPYEELGVDQFTYCSSFGMPWKEQRRSLELFIKEVMPAFKEPAAAEPAAAR